MPQTTNITGTLHYNPDEAWNGYTLLPASTFHTGKGAVLIDMNGRVVQKWEGTMGAFHNILFPDGSIMGCTGSNEGHRLDQKDLIHVDFDNKLIWKYEDATDVNLPDGTIVRSARAHHDFQRAGSPTGYYCPNQLPDPKGKTLFASTKMVKRPDITPYDIADTWLIEVDQEGNICWDWLLTDYWDKMGFSEVAKAVYSRNPKFIHDCNYTKETYFNNCAYVGPNKWYDAGDERFNPENIIVDIRSWNVSFIISKKTKEIVWRLGPDYSISPELRKIGTIIGQHHVHIIPKGLPGEGNVLIFDNGGEAGFGDSNPNSFDGVYTARRWYSRVLEINPVTLEVVWQYGDHEDPVIRSMLRFFSAYCSSAQRLPNGNTLITETVGGRVFEVTKAGKIVWEFVDPGAFTFRAFRYPYDWVPQRPAPKEVAIVPPRQLGLTLDNFTPKIDEQLADFYTEEGEAWHY